MNECIPYSASLDEEALARDLAGVLNSHCVENGSETPDFILADYLVSCIRAWNAAQQGRSTWHSGGVFPKAEDVKGIQDQSSE